MSDSTFQSHLRYVSRLSEQVYAVVLGSWGPSAQLLVINELSVVRDTLKSSLRLVRKDNYC